MPRRFYPSDLNSRHVALGLIAEEEPIRNMVGRNIRTFREVRRATQEDLGFELGLSGSSARVTVARMEAEAPISLDRLALVAAILGVYPAQLFWRSQRLPTGLIKRD